MKRFLRREAADPGAAADLRQDVERARVLIEESRESVVVLDAERRVLAASRRARESIPGLLEGAPFPDEVLADAGREPVQIPYEVDGRPETLVYVSEPGELAAYEELRAGFTAAVSHELRTPLARLLALLESVSLPGADTAELVAQARAEVERMGELIDDVLFLGELESGRVEVALGSTHALLVLEQVVTRLAPRAETAGIRLELDCPASAELPLRQRMIEVVAGNLVSNAIRYAGERATCLVTVEVDPGGPALVVSDTGRGVPDADLPRLFERFFRSDRARTTHGSGLGLAIVKHIVTSAGGTVQARNCPGGGLEVRCSFPRRGP